MSVPHFRAIVSANCALDSSTYTFLTVCGFFPVLFLLCSSSSFVHRVENLKVCAIYCPPKCSLAGKLRHFIDLIANIANGDKRKPERTNRRKCRDGRDGRGRDREAAIERTSELQIFGVCETVCLFKSG